MSASSLLIFAPECSKCSENGGHTKKHTVASDVEKSN